MDKIIEESEEIIEELEEIIEELEKENKIKDKLIKQLITDEMLKEYISSDEVIRAITELFKDTQYSLHKSTFKKFMTNDNLLQHELLNSLKQYQKFNKKLYLTTITTTKTLNKKLKELEALKLIEVSKEDYSISATDKLATLIENKSTRVYKSIKSEKELQIITEDKIIAARLNVLEEKDEEVKAMERNKLIYKLDKYSYLIARKESETLEKIKERIDYLIYELKDRIYIVYTQGYPMYLETEYDIYKKIIYKEEFKTIDNYLKYMHDTTRSCDEEKFRKQQEDYYFDLTQEILNQNIELEDETIYSHNIKDYKEIDRLYNKVTIYIHENTRNTVLDYLKNSLKSQGINYEIIKYITN